MSYPPTMEGPDVSQYTDHETVAREWSADKIYDSCAHVYGQDEGPMIFAAGHEDSSVLRLLLKRTELLLSQESRLELVNLELDRWVTGQDSEKMPTTLLRAIERQRPENVRLLLEYGADPNGVYIETQKGLARTYRRFWKSEQQRGTWQYQVHGCQPVRVDDVGKVSSEFIPLTEEELVERRATSHRVAFWHEPYKHALDYSRDEVLFNAVVRAGTSTPEILDQLLADGADVSAWVGTENKDQLPDEEDLSPSALTLSTPLHAAIASFNTTMLRALLHRGFNPNARALITGSCALTPLQYAIILGNTEAYSVLNSHNQLDKAILTPVFNVHLLHFAIAHLRTHTLQMIDLPLSAAPPTALGHTLLHTACLPHTFHEVQTSSKAEQSVHDTRSLSFSHAIGYPSGDQRYDSHGRKIDWFQERPAPCVPLPRTPKDELRRQEEVCKLIIAELGAEHICIADVHGNTALHYLASAFDLNEDLIVWMREQAGGEDVWQKTENMWGHTPQAIWDDNMGERSKGPDESWDSHGRYQYSSRPVGCGLGPEPGFYFAGGRGRRGEGPTKF
jgi:hypothetical protein